MTIDELDALVTGTVSHDAADFHDVWPKVVAVLRAADAAVKDDDQPWEVHDALRRVRAALKALDREPRPLP